jgi:hypothetical protein
MIGRGLGLLPALVASTTDRCLKEARAQANGVTGRSSLPHGWLPHLRLTGGNARFRARALALDVARTALDCAAFVKFYDVWTHRGKQISDDFLGFAASRPRGRRRPGSLHK